MQQDKSNDTAVLANVRIVMVNTTHPGNIGAAARAMKNMGLSDLVLVDPKRFPDPEAEIRAAGAGDIIVNASIVATLSDAIADCAVVVGTSARERSMPIPLLPPRQCAEQLVAEAGQHRVALVFGREDRGLTNEELQQCHWHVHIPTNADYSSLNVAAAIQVLSYECRVAALNSEHQDTMRDWDVPAATVADLERLHEHLAYVLESIEFLDPDNPRQTMPRLQRLLNRARLDQMELSMLRGILRQIERK